MPERAPLLLASSSPRRLALLRQVGVTPDRIAAPEVDETGLSSLPVNIHTGPPEEIQHDPAVRDAYLGHADEDEASGDLEAAVAVDEAEEVST